MAPQNQSDENNEKNHTNEKSGSDEENTSDFEDKNIQKIKCKMKFKFKNENEANSYPKLILLKFKKENEWKKIFDENEKVLRKNFHSGRGRFHDDGSPSFTSSCKFSKSFLRDAAITKNDLNRKLKGNILKNRGTLEDF